MNLIERLLARRRALLDDNETVLRLAETEDRDLTDEENDAFTARGTEIDDLDTRIEELCADEARRTRATNADLSENRNQERSPATVTSEARVYTRESDRQGTSFLRDVVNAQIGDFDAQDRLRRHMREVDVEGEVERRDVGTGAFAGLTVPQYLTDLVAPVARPMRPFLDICRKLPLPPSGMTVNLSRITTGTATAAQASENAATQETDADDTLLTVNVRTVAGQQDVSRQVIDRSTGADQVVIQDLVNSYHSELDRQALNADGTSGTHVGIFNVAGNIAVTYTDASPTAAELYPKLADLIQQVQAGVYMGLTHFVMAPRRWWWLAAAVGTTFPFLTVPNAGVQQGGVVGGTDYQGVNRSILGVPVVVDGNVVLTNNTDQDIVHGVTAEECFLWEDEQAPLFIRAEDVGAGNLTVKFVVYGYSAFTAGRRPTSHGDIQGTGLAAPTF